MSSDGGLIYALLEEQHDEVVRATRSASLRLARAYARIQRWLQGELDAISEMIARAEANGEVVSPSWFFRQERLRVLLAEASERFEAYSTFVRGEVRGQMMESAGLGGEHFAAQMGALGLGGTFARLPGEAIGNIVAALWGPGTPLDGILNSLGGASVEAIRDALFRGVMLGLNPREVARIVRRVSGANLMRVLRICRTEMMRAYRVATLQNYNANSDVVAGWVWLSALDERTCPACWMMHGTFHGLDEQLFDHPNGRCVMVPQVRMPGMTGREGERGTRWGWPEIRLGVEEFRSLLTPAQQQKVLGAGVYEAWRDGRINLRDIPTYSVSPIWGKSIRARGLSELLRLTEAERAL